MVLKMAEVISKILTMNDTEIGAWFRKAAVDVMNGCKDPDCDPLIRQQFEHALQELQKRQEHNATMYRNRLARQGKSLKINDQEPTTGNYHKPATISANEASNPPTRESETRGPQTDNFNGDATTSDGVEVFHTRESGVSEPTTISNISQDAQNGNAWDERRSGSNSVATVNLVHPAPIAESARCATSEAVKALADASTREGEDGRDHRGNTGLLESSTSAKTLTEARQSQARESRRTGGTPKRVEMPTASHAETLPVRSPAELKKPYGTCGHVMLTDTEGRHLREVYGPHLAIAIDILDGYIENDGKAAKKYKNHAAVLRKGNWVWNKVQEMILNEKRIENASKQGDRRSFRQQEREHQTELMHKSLFAPSIGMDNREITNG
jgi:hypothetical protein